MKTCNENPKGIHEELGKTNYYKGNAAGLFAQR
jgi:hypothetical protein